jgi:hypothetical protein
VSYDTVYYWIGGRERGEWRQVLVAAPVAKVLADKRAELARMGYVALCGSTKVGPPTGPPTDAHFRALGL